MAQLDDIAPSSNAASHPAAAACALLLPEILAVPEEKLLAIKMDVIAGVTTVLGALVEIRALRPETLTSRAPMRSMGGFRSRSTSEIAALLSNCSKSKEPSSAV